MPLVLTTCDPDSYNKRKTKVPLSSFIILLSYLHTLQLTTRNKMFFLLQISLELLFPYSLPTEPAH